MHVHLRSAFEKLFLCTHARTHLHASVTAESDDVVAEDGVLVSVELRSGHLGGGSHTRGVRDTLVRQMKQETEVAKAVYIREDRTGKTRGKTA